MFTLRRWWDKNALKMAGFGVVIGATYWALQSQSALVFEVYNFISYPFQPKAGQMDYLKTADIKQLQDELQEVKSQNQQLKQLGSYSAAVPTKGILAPIILRSADNWWQQVTIGRGKVDGVAVNHIVVATGGIVGRVIAVSDRTSRVLLVSDPTSRMGVVIGRTRNMGTLRGTRADRAELEFFDKRPTVKKGDIVSTSAVSQLFPSGLGVGRVIDINLNQSPAPVATVEFTSPLGYLEWVTVHPHNPLATDADLLPPMSKDAAPISPKRQNKNKK
jgi:rod shape-determining protein MreC